MFTPYSDANFIIGHNIIHNMYYINNNYIIHNPWSDTFSYFENVSLAMGQV